VETQEIFRSVKTRTVLCSQCPRLLLKQNTRAGIFRLQLRAAGNLDVESISGAALSHWTELKAPEGASSPALERKTEGEHQFAVSLSDREHKQGRA